jgi:hypothetical protein
MKLLPLFFALILIKNVDGQPIFRFTANQKLNNFYSFQNIMHFDNLKVLVNSKATFVAGSDTSASQIHIWQKKHIDSVGVNFYIKNPIADSLNGNPRITSFFQIDSNGKFCLVFEYKYLVFIQIKQKLFINKIVYRNSAENRPYRDYYYFQGKLYGIFPLRNFMVNNHTYNYEEKFTIDDLSKIKPTTLLIVKRTSSEFWNLGMSGYVSCCDEKIIVTNAVSNQIQILNLITNKTDTLNSILPNFTSLNMGNYDSLSLVFSPQMAGDKLNFLLDSKVEKFNYIFKVLSPSKNQIWVITTSNSNQPYQLSRIQYEPDKNKWKLIDSGPYNYKIIKKESDTVTINNYPIEYLNNVVGIHRNQLAVISNNKLDFNPFDMTYSQVGRLLNSNPNPKSLKIYQFNIQN